MMEPSDLRCPICADPLTAEDALDLQNKHMEKLREISGEREDGLMDLFSEFNTHYVHKKCYVRYVNFLSVPKNMSEKLLDASDSAACNSYLDLNNYFGTGGKDECVLCNVDSTTSEVVHLSPNQLKRLRLVSEKKRDGLADKFRETMKLHEDCFHAYVPNAEEGDSGFLEKLCLLCNQDLVDDVLEITVKLRDKLVVSSGKREDDLAHKIRDLADLQVHEKCFRSYNHYKNIRKAQAEAELEKQAAKAKSHPEEAQPSIKDESSEVEIMSSHEEEQQSLLKDEDSEVEIMSTHEEEQQSLVEDEESEDKDDRAEEKEHQQSSRIEDDTTDDDGDMIEVPERREREKPQRMIEEEESQGEDEIFKVETPPENDSESESETVQVDDEPMNAYEFQSEGDLFQEEEEPQLKKKKAQKSKSKPEIKPQLEPEKPKKKSRKSEAKPREEESKKPKKRSRKPEVKPREESEQPKKGVDEPKRKRAGDDDPQEEPNAKRVRKNSVAPAIELIADHFKDHGECEVSLPELLQDFENSRSKRLSYTYLVKKLKALYREEITVVKSKERGPVVKYKAGGMVVD